MVPSHRACGFAAGAALLPVYGWDYLSSQSMRRLGDPRDKVAAGMNPAAKAALVSLTHPLGPVTQAPPPARLAAPAARRSPPDTAARTSTLSATTTRPRASRAGRATSRHSGA